MKLTAPTLPLPTEAAATKPVIALCGPPGCGKSTLARALLAKLGSGCLIDIDDYQSFTDQSTQQLEQWIAAGADYNTFDLSPLATDLHSLKHGGSIAHPQTHTAVHAEQFILFETHFGRGHQQTGQYIDYLIWLDIPLDIALSRNLVSFCQSFNQPQTAAEGLDWLGNYLNAYSQTIRHTLTLQRQHIRPGANIWLDACQPIEQLAAEICTKIPNL